MTGSGKPEKYGVPLSTVAAPLEAVYGPLRANLFRENALSEQELNGIIKKMIYLSLCRTIEIDLKEMIGDPEIPAPISPINGVLM